MEFKVKNSEILFIYDAKMTNPNGDPDDENKPRMDYQSRRCLVSDVRLKRYLRDYWISKGYDVWVRKLEDGETVSAKRRIKGLVESAKQELNKSYKSDDEAINDKTFQNYLLENLLDIRFFGATIPTEKSSLTFTGPVQFTWGFSLNKAEILSSSTISSHFAGREEGEKGQYGTFGKDWRIKYALIAFYGIISSYRARWTYLSEKDIEFLDESMIKALKIMANTRSKIGQYPRLYLRVEYNDNETILGDFRNFIKLENEENLEDIRNVELDLTKLSEKLKGYKDRINKIVLWVDSEFENRLKLENNKKLKDYLNNLLEVREIEDK